MAAASINQRGLVWLRAVVVITGMAAGGALIWLLGSRYNLVPLPAIVRGAIFIAVTAPLVILMSDPNLFTPEYMQRPASVGLATAVGTLLGANIAANFPVGFGTGAELIMDLAMAVGGILALCYYIYAVRKCPPTADRIGLALYTALCVIGMSLLTIWIVHIVHPRYNNGGAVRIPMLTLLWMSLRMSRKYVKDNSYGAQRHMQESA